MVHHHEIVSGGELGQCWSVKQPLLGLGVDSRQESDMKRYSLRLCEDKRRRGYITST